MDEAEECAVVHRSPVPAPAGGTIAWDPGNLVVLRSGAVKRSRCTRDGNELIAEFFLPGEVIGLQAGEKAAADEAFVVLERAHYCEMPWDSVHELMAHDPSVRHTVSEILLESLSVSRERLLRACRGSARQRVAAFLLDLLNRRERTPSPTPHIRLAMDRREIAAYLDLTIETVSRVLSRLRREGTIDLRGRWLRVCDRHALDELAEGGALPRSIA